MNKFLNKQDIMSHYNISSATVDNWVKNSIPDAQVEKNLYDVDAFDFFINENEKLEKRANKKNNKSIEKDDILLEYLEDSKWIKSYLSFVDKNKNNIPYVIENVINIYKKRVLNLNIEVDTVLEKIIPKNEIYAYSVCYQLILDSGKKSETGSYYTPKNIVKKEVEKHISEKSKILEPCCGCGFYIIEYIKTYQKKYNKNPDGLIFANDIDKNACEITRLNIISLTNNEMFDFQIYNCDGLNLPYDNFFDLVITNPPYGIKNKYQMLNSNEIFSHFIHKCLSSYLKKDGVLSFVLPTSFLNVKRHHEIRKYVINNFNILEIEYYGKSFSNVMSDIIVINIKKNKNKNNIVINNNNKIHQKYFVDNNYLISNHTEQEYQFVNKLYSKKHLTLKYEPFALGIITGNNKKYLSKIKNKSFPHPVISGKNIGKGEIKGEVQYLYYDFEKFQQVPKLETFKGSKIIYKFISNEISTTVDYSDSFTLNSANVIKIEKANVPAEYISAILNSKVMNKIFRIKFSNQIKILKNDLMELPIFLFDNKTISTIVKNYKKGMHLDNEHIINKKLLSKDDFYLL